MTTTFSNLPRPLLQMFGVLIVLLLLLPKSALASSGTVLVITAGNDADQKLLSANANIALSDAGIGLATLQDAELNGFELIPTIVCLEQGEDCAHLVRNAPARWVLLLRLRREGEGPDADQRAIANLFSADTGELLQVKQAVCQRCSDRERMAKVITQLVTEIAEAELAHHASETYLTVNATPIGILRIDGEVVGPTGQSYQVTPGEHKIEVQSDGYPTVTQSLLVDANEHKSLSVTLSKPKSGNTTPSPRPKSDGTMRTYLGIFSIGGGLLAIGGGVYLLSIDGAPASDKRQTTYTTRDTQTAGIASIVIGTGAVLVGGVVLLLTGDDTHKKPVITAAPIRGGFTLGFNGDF